MSDVYNSQLDAFELYHLYTEQQRRAGGAGGAGAVVPALGHAVAGAVGSAVSSIAVYPLDLIVTRLQSQRQLRKSGRGSGARYTSILDAGSKIVATEGGARGLYAGVREDTLKTVADAFLFFLAYTAVRQSRAFRREPGQALSVPAELSVGLVAGAFSKALTAPIANVVTRLQTSSMAAAGTASKAAPTAASVARQIRAEKGVRGFWSGYSASLVLTLNPSLTFFFFETFKRAATRRGADSKNLPAPATFLLAAVSKALASAVTYPFSLAKARIQVSSKAPTEPEREKGGDAGAAAAHGLPGAAAKKARGDTVFSTIAQIARDEGLLALYEGLGGEVLKGFLSHGITMMAKDWVHGFVVSLYFAVLRLLRRHPEIQEAVEDAASMAEDSACSAVEMAKESAETVRQKVSHAGKEAGGAAAEALERVKGAKGGSTE